MPITRTLDAAGRGLLGARFPARKLAIGFALLLAAATVFALVDRVVPPAPPATPAEKAAVVEKAAPGKPAAAPRKAPLAAESPFSAGPLLAMAAMLGGAIGLIFVLKRVLRGSRHVPGGRKILRVKDVLAIGPKRAIYLIGLEHRSLVVGVSGDQLSLLSEYSDEAEAAPEAAKADAADNARTGEIVLAPRGAVAATPAAATPAPAAHVDALAAEELVVPPPEEVAAAASSPAPSARSFPFASVDARPKPDRKPRADRVPHKFRQLLERAAETEGHAR
jgi:flagellar biogenesis protein FliO